ncbi:MAG TPA: redoxin domain-containing protein, partial [bacterium]|nr:redoxin domain-containing protein [bacterium]
NGEEEFLEYLKENLGIKAHQPLEPKLGHYPEVPDFQAETSDGKTIRRSDYLGRVLHVIFFSPKCPHCQHELQFLRDQVYPEYHAKGYEVLAVNVAKMDEKTKPLYDAQHYPWPLVDDSNRKLRTQFTFNRSVPENFLVDKQGRAHFYSVGYSEQRNDLYQMQIKKLLGLATEATMNPQRMATVKACEVCHEPESVDWAVSKHARALDSLAYKSEDRNPACVSCHTLGYGDPKGYQSMTDKKTGKQMAYVPPDLAGVQCESCHGIGGPHVKGAHAVTVNEMKQKCLACHTKEWSSGFDVDKAMTQVNHSRAAEIMKMSVEEKEKMVRE